MKLFSFVRRRLAICLIAFCIYSQIFAQTEEIDGIIYDVVTITVDAPSYDNAKPPIFARVKYNKLCPLVITSDDMGGCELNRNWAFFNGYPVFDSKDYGHIPTGMNFLETPYNASALSIQNQTLKRNSHQPLTYSDGTGGVRRFTATSAIWPHHINGSNYTLLTNQDPKVMIRTGWSFAQHDVDNSYTTDASTIAGRFQALSELWEGITGVGLKVLVEPAGTHMYIDAGKQSDEICWNIFQNGVAGTYPEKNPIPINEWTTGTDWTSFSSKPAETTRRRFFQGDENAWKDDISNADGSNIILGGTHGIGDDILLYIKELAIGGSHAKADKFWVASADEVWEYYHLYNNAQITDISYSDSKLTFKVKVPRYKKNQFRELTINIPGITGGTAYSFSDNIITGSAQQNAGQYTINFGLENKICTYIEELTNYYRSHFHNTYVKDDVQYLINLLKAGTARNTYQSALDAEPTYSYTIKNNFGTMLLTGASDSNDEVYYKYPKYSLHENTLYETPKNTSTIQNKSVNYVGSYTPIGQNQEVTINYTATAINNVSYYTEGENINGVTVATQEYSKITENSGIAYALRFASNGAAGEILSPVTVTTITPGKYTLVAAIGDTHTSNTAQFTFKVGDKNVLSLTTEDVSGYIKEYSKEGIMVKANQSLTIEAINSGGSFWVDYLYLIKTGEYDATTPDVELTTKTATVDMTDDSNKQVTITATATAKGTASVIQTVIKDSNDAIVAQSSTATCSYTFTPGHVGNHVFTAEATDNTENGGKTGLSDELTVTVKSDFTLTATSNMGDNVGSYTFSEQTADKTYRFLYPRFLLKGTKIYETEAKSSDNKVLHYGEDLSFSLANKTIEKTIQYDPIATNVVFYSEGEDINGTRTWTWTNATMDFGKAEAYALTLGSMGKCGAVTDITVTTLPAGTYRVTAGIGTTNSATWTFKYGSATLGIFNPSPTFAISTFTSDNFTIDANTAITVTCNQGKDNSQNWLDYVYIQQIPEALSIDMREGQKWASWYGEYDYPKPEGTKAYIVTGVDGTTVTISEIDYIPANTGVLIKRETTDAANITSESSLIEEVATDGNLLAHENPIAYTDYVLSNNTFVLFGGGSIGAHRSYLPGSAISNGSRSLSIGIDEGATSLETLLVHDTTNDRWYTLQGILIKEKPKKKGLYIHKGEKRIIK